MDLQIIWFLLLGVLLMGYAILDGFDLGVGMLHLFVKRDKDHAPIEIKHTWRGAVW